MDRKTLLSGLRKVAQVAAARNQASTARQIEVLLQKLGSAYYFQVDEGGYGDVIPDKEYVEFDTKDEVIDYAADKLYGEGAGYTAEQAAENKGSLDFEDARATLMSIGEFGNMGQPVLPPDTLTGSNEPVDSAFYKEVEVPVEEVEVIKDRRKPNKR